MTALSPAKQAAIATLARAAPDGVLAALDRAFADSPAEGPAGLVRGILAVERRDRRTRATVFGPLLPMFRPRPDGFAAPSFPAEAPRRVWEEVRRRRPDGIAALEARIAALEYDETVPASILDGFCAETAAILREGEFDRWGFASQAEADDLAAFLDLAPLARRALPQLGEWLQRLTEERAAALRLVFRDAAAVAEDGAPRLLEILAAHLSEAHLILRLFPVLTHGAGEALVAASELAPFGERLLADAEARVTRAEAFGLRSSPEAARRTVFDLTVAAGVFAELEACLELSRDGQWGGRVAAGRNRANELMARALRQTEQAVTRALPTVAARIAGRVTRAVPDLSQAPEPEALDQARTLLILLAESRALAPALGCGGAWVQTCEALGERLDAYVDDLLAVLSDPDRAPDLGARAEGMAAIAAEFLARVRDPAAGRLVRRRLSSALADAAAKGPSRARA